MNKNQIFFILILISISVLFLILGAIIVRAHDPYSYKINGSIEDLGYYLNIKFKEYKLIILQAKKDWGENVDAPFLARKKYEMDLAHYNNIKKQMKLLGIYHYDGKETKEEKNKKKHNRRYRQ